MRISHKKVEWETNYKKEGNFGGSSFPHAQGFLCPHAPMVDKKIQNCSDAL